VSSSPSSLKSLSSLRGFDGGCVGSEAELLATIVPVHAVHVGGQVTKSFLPLIPPIRKQPSGGKIGMTESNGPWRDLPTKGNLLRCASGSTDAPSSLFSEDHLSLDAKRVNNPLTQAASRGGSAVIFQEDIILLQHSELVRPSYLTSKRGQALNDSEDDTSIEVVTFLLGPAADVLLLEGLNGITASKNYKLISPERTISDNGKDILADHTIREEALGKVASVGKDNSLGDPRSLSASRGSRSGRLIARMTTGVLRILPGRASALSDHSDIKARDDVAA
jgi:hypothetical protein